MFADLGWRWRVITPEQLKSLRMEAGRSISESARDVHISDRSWQRYESGDRAIPDGVVELFCIKNGLNNTAREIFAKAGRPKI